MTVTRLDRRKYSKYKKKFESMSHIDLLQEYAVIIGKRATEEEVNPELAYHLFNTLANLKGSTDEMKALAIRYRNFYEQQLDT